MPALVLAYAASAQLMSDLLEAEEIALRAQELEPQLDAVKKALRHIEMHEKRIANRAEYRDDDQSWKTINIY